MIAAKQRNDCKLLVHFIFALCADRVFDLDKENQVNDKHRCISNYYYGCYRA